VSPKTLVTIKQLSLGLLGDMVASLWEPKSIEHVWPNSLPKPTNQAFNASDKNHLKGRRNLVPKLRKNHTYFHLWNIFKLTFTKYTTYS
jgi:hypothetical protein